jgi:hypothetical protein
VVTVYLDPAWSDPSQIAALKQALTNWQAAQSVVGCNCYVVFEYTTTRGAGTYPLIVLREEPANEPNVRAQVVTARTQFVNDRVALTKATVAIHPSVTSNEALTIIMAH